MAVRRTLPVETTSFVGRAGELLQLEKAFAGGARLVTITGPPGIGKSRLALRYAARRLAAGTFRDGVIACELVDATSAGDLCAALGHALDVVLAREPRGGDVVAELGVRLGEVLILLDNVEQLVAVGPETIGRWLTLSAQVRFLATSRERLRLAGEVVHELGPLSLPGEGVDVAASEAVQLFVERARAVRPQFAVSPENAGAVAEIVQQLDGIPLAIELGATRMGVLSPVKLLERLPRRLDLLSAAIRNPAARQRTLREAIDASFALLSPVEQSALEQVSVFRGGFDLEAAEAVVDLSEHPGAPPLLDVLSSLSDKSLLFARSPAAFPDELRFGLYLSIREHAWARLEASGRAPEAQRRHAAHFLGTTAPPAPEDEGPAEIDRLRRIAQETHNLAAVHRHLLGTHGSDPEGAAKALRAALALEATLTRWGPISMLRTMLDDALHVPGCILSTELRLRGLLAKANACRLLGRLRESLSDQEAVFALAEQAGDARMRAIVAVGVGMVCREMGRLRDAERWLESALPGLRACGARRVEVRARAALEQIHTVLGRGEDARAHRGEVERLLGDERDPELIATSRAVAATLAIAEGRLEEAELDLETARAMVRDLSLPSFEIVALSTLALLRQDQGRLAEARASAEAAASLARKLGNGRMEGFSLAHLGTVLVQMGELVEARSALGRATALVRESGDARATALFTAALAATVARLGHAAEAARLFGAAEGSLEEVGDPMLLGAIEAYRAVMEPERAPRVIAETRERAARSVHLRTALRILADALAAGARPITTAPQAAPGPGAPAGPAADKARAWGGALVVSPDGRWCRLPDGREVSFRRGKSQRLMLLRLVEERLVAPGRALPLGALFTSGWPGERASEEALANRVYVGVSRLRKLGFAGLILSRDDGFLLDPAVPAYRGEKPS